MDFDRIQQKWLEQKMPDTHLDSILNQGDSLLARIKKIQRKTVFSSLFVSVSFAFVFIVFALIFRENPSESGVFYCGMGMIFCSMIGVLVFIWSLVPTYRNRSLNLNSQEFLTKILRKLHLQKLMLDRIVPLYLFLLMAGLNLIYLDVLREETEFVRWMAHGLVTGFIGVVYLLSMPFYRRRYARDIAPLIQDVEELLQKWEIDS